MSVPNGYADLKTCDYVLPTSTPNWTINVSDIKTIKVSNVSLSTSEKDIRLFFSFSGDIQFVEFQRETEMTKLAYVTFKETQGADTAMLMSGATVVDRPVSISLAENYQLPPYAPPLNMEPKQAATGSHGSAVYKTEDVVSTMLALGFVLGKDALNKARSFDERHHLTSNASATVAFINRKIGLIEKLSTGTAALNGKVREIDEWFQVSDITKQAFSAAEQTGSAIMSNHYVSTGASWVSSAFSMFAKAAEDVSSMTRQKVIKAEAEKKDTLYRDMQDMFNDYARFNLDKPSFVELTAVSVHTSNGM